MPSDDITVKTGWSAGVLGRVVGAQAVYYARDWGFGLSFETKLAAEMAEYFSRYNPQTDLFQSAWKGNDFIASLTLDGGEQETPEDTAHLRWFIASDGARGTGIGTALFAEAVVFARGAGFKELYLWTFDGLAPARKIYDRFGFQLMEEHSGRVWGTEVLEQKFSLRL